MYKKIFGIAVFLLCICSLVFGQQEEKLTITTYYPSPAGSYATLRTQILYLQENMDGLISFEYPDTTYDKRLRITAGKSDTGDNDQGASIDLHGNNVGSGNLDLVAGRNGEVIFWTSPTGLSALARMYIRPDGNVGVGIANPGTYKLYVNGDLYAERGFKPGGGSWSDSSDIRLKKNIKPINNALDKLLQLRGTMFEWSEPEHANLLPGTQLGMVGQEVEKVFPQWVGTDREGYKTLTFRGFEALTVEAVRELSNTVKVLLDENKALKAKIKEIESRLK